RPPPPSSTLFPYTTLFRSSYSWMAERLGDRNARRAVGHANGSNMLCVVIPCHRVIRADGTLCGYGGGLWRKKWLLDHERRYAKKDRKSTRLNSSHLGISYA